jgi:hypothetical protein
LSKYDEIEAFVVSCSNFLYSNYDIGSSFPVNEVSSKIQTSRTYLSRGLGNRYVNNCSRLKDGLREIPENLFNKHVSYLSSKIQQNSGKYKNYKYQSDYSKEIYTPLKNQIDGLDNDIYGINSNTFDSNHDSLIRLLSEDNRKAADDITSRNN